MIRAMMIHIKKKKIQAARITMATGRDNPLWLSALLLAVQLSFAQPVEHGIAADDYEKWIGRITINCSEWTADLDSVWISALDSIKLKEGLILDLRAMTGNADAKIPELLGYFFDEATMSNDDVEQYRIFLNGMKPYTGPLLIQLSENASPETAQAVNLFIESRANTQLTTCDLDCRLSQAPMWHFRAAMDRIRVQQQERMDQFFEGGK
jgi:hypothetical protein